MNATPGPGGVIRRPIASDQPRPPTGPFGLQQYLIQMAQRTEAIARDNLIMLGEIRDELVRSRELLERIEKGLPLFDDETNPPSTTSADPP